MWILNVMAFNSEYFSPSVCTVCGQALDKLLLLPGYRNNSSWPATDSVCVMTVSCSPVIQILPQLFQIALSSTCLVICRQWTSYQPQRESPWPLCGQHWARSRMIHHGEVQPVNKSAGVWPPMTFYTSCTDIGSAAELAKGPMADCSRYWEW